MSDSEVLRAETQKRYRKTHKLEALQYLQQWRIKNPKKYRAQQIRAQEKNPIRLWCISTRTNHRKKGYQISISIDELEKIAREVVVCPYCDSPLDWSLGTKGSIKPNSPSLDRVNNGTIIKPDTIQVICYQCNLMKGNRSEQDLLTHAIKIAENLKKKGSNG